MNCDGRPELPLAGEQLDGGVIDIDHFATGTIRRLVRALRACLGDLELDGLHGPFADVDHLTADGNLDDPFLGDVTVRRHLAGWFSPLHPHPLLGAGNGDRLLFDDDVLARL